MSFVHVYIQEPIRVESEPIREWNCLINFRIVTDLLNNFAFLVRCSFQTHQQMFLKLLFFYYRFFKHDVFLFSNLFQCEKRNENYRILKMI